LIGILGRAVARRVAGSDLPEIGRALVPWLPTHEPWGAHLLVVDPLPVYKNLSFFHTDNDLRILHGC